MPIAGNVHTATDSMRDTRPFDRTALAVSRLSVKEEYGKTGLSYYASYLYLLEYRRNPVS